MNDTQAKIIWAIWIAIIVASIITLINFMPSEGMSTCPYGQLGYCPRAMAGPPRWRIGPDGTKMPLFAEESDIRIRPLPYAAVPRSYAAAVA